MPLSPLASHSGPRPAHTPVRYEFAFPFLWVASTASALAGWVLRFTLPLVAVHLTRSPLLTSGVTFLFTAPWLAFGLQAGAIIDRHDR